MVLRCIVFSQNRVERKGRLITAVKHAKHFHKAATLYYIFPLQKCLIVLFHLKHKWAVALQSRQMLARQKATAEMPLAAI